MPEFVEGLLKPKKHKANNIPKHPCVSIQHALAKFQKFASRMPHSNPEDNSVCNLAK